MPLKVYYIDDEPELCNLFCEYHDSPQVEVKTFTSGAEAIEYAKDNPPDLVFIDFRLPGTTGEEVARALDPKTPKYLVTGEIHIQSSELFRGVLSKPCNPQAMEELIKQYL